MALMRLPHQSLLTFRSCNLYFSFFVSFKSLRKVFLLIQISPISIMLPFSKTFLMLALRCVSTWRLNRKQQVHNTRVTTSKLWYAHAENTDLQLIMLAMLGVCSGRSLRGVAQTWRGFSWDHKGGAAYREAPLPFIEKNVAAHTRWTDNLTNCSGF